MHPDELTTYYRSVIAFGRAKIIENKKIKTDVLKVLIKKYSEDLNEKSINKIIEDKLDLTNVIEIEIEHLTGKENKALAKNRKEMI